MTEFSQQDFIQLIALLLLGLALSIQFIFKKQLRSESEKAHSADHKPGQIRKLFVALLVMSMVLQSVLLYASLFGS